MRMSSILCVLCALYACGEESGFTVGPPDMPADVNGPPPASAAAGMCLGPAAPNLDCPPLGPYDGECAARDVCCRRSSNSLAEAALGPDEPLVLSYRLNESQPINNLDGVGFSSIADTVSMRTNLAKVSLLLQIELPRQGGVLSAGTGAITHGYGRYNCDGTYSFYGPQAAADRTALGLSGDPGRYQPVRETFTVSAPVDQTAALFAAIRMLPTSAVRYPVLNDQTYALDWELIERDLLVTRMDFSGAGRDCVGAREGSEWNFGGRYESYSRMDETDQEVIATISQSYCNLVSLGLASVDVVQANPCVGGTRCMPGSPDCAWKALPDSLCPNTAAEQGAFRCHLGAENNPNGEAEYGPVQCGPMSPEGPCCDPLGQSTTLPACNAYRIVRDFVAGAVDITPVPAASLQPQCE